MALSSRSYSYIKTTTLIFGLGIALALSTSFAADKEKPVAADKEKSVAVDKEKPASTPSPDAVFIKKAADAGMTEVEAGKVGRKMGRETT